MLTEFSIPASGDTPAGSLSHFYPIISSFFAGLWDPEVCFSTQQTGFGLTLRDSQEAVRQKVGTLIQVRPRQRWVLRPDRLFLRSHFAPLISHLSVNLFKLGSTAET